MKNKMTDLKNHLYAALERLNDESLTEDKLATEISRAQAVAHLGKVLVEQAKTALMFAKVTGQTRELSKDEYSIEQEKIERPAAEYSNSGHLNTVNKLA
jgi:hypothetical protein